VIEIDGESHNTAEAVAYDKRRDEILGKYGLTVMRIKDIQVKRKMHVVLSEINDFIDDWERKNAASAD
jgi:very-short-patch-repair endonuclease